MWGICVFKLNFTILEELVGDIIFIILIDIIIINHDTGNINERG